MVSFVGFNIGFSRVFFLASIFCHLSATCQQPAMSVTCWWPVGKLLVICWPTVGWQSVEVSYSSKLPLNFYCQFILCYPCYIKVLFCSFSTTIGLECGSVTFFAIAVWWPKFIEIGQILNKLCDYVPHGVIRVSAMRKINAFGKVLSPFISMAVAWQFDSITCAIQLYHDKVKNFFFLLFFDCLTVWLNSLCHSTLPWLS